MDLDRSTEDFVWKDGERLIAYGPSALASLPAFLRATEMESYVVLTTEGRRTCAPEVIAGAEDVIELEPGRVDELAAAALELVGDRPVVGVGGGRVIDTAKAVGGANGKPVGAVPTTLSGAPMTPFHRLPANFSGRANHVRPKFVIAIPDLMSSQPNDLRVGSAMNALAHAIESAFVTTSSPVPRLVSKGAIELLFGALDQDELPESIKRSKLALGAIEAGYSVGVTGYGIHHVICQTIVRLANVPHAPTYGVLLPYTLEVFKVRDAITFEMVAEAMGTREPSLEIVKINKAAGLPISLSELGVSSDLIELIVAEASTRRELNLTPGGADANTVRALVEAAM
ncbi:MAG TPA: iron-containing alcohol dehydrogenase [Solirubrobacterales bacterium]|nr:iron-containing alcohol dehydrogenase [Solirubrobacterales bacterium]